MTMREVDWRVKAIDKRMNIEFKLEMALHDKVMKNKKDNSIPDLTDKQKKAMEKEIEKKLNRMNQNGK